MTWLSASTSWRSLPPSLTSEVVSSLTRVSEVEVASKLSDISLYWRVSEAIISLFSCCHWLSFSTDLLSWSKFSWMSLFISEFICFWNSSVTFFITSTRASVLLFLSSSVNSSNLLSKSLLVFAILSSISITSPWIISSSLPTFSLISSSVPLMPEITSRISPRWCVYSLTSCEYLATELIDADCCAVASSRLLKEVSIEMFASLMSAREFSWLRCNTTNESMAEVMDFCVSDILDITSPTVR